MKKQVYWEDELLYTSYNAKKESKLIFVADLRLYLFNNKQLDVAGGFARVSFDGSMTYENAINSDETIEYRQIEGIESKEELLKWKEILSIRSFSYMKRSTSYLAWVWAKRASNEFLQDESKHFLFSPHKHQICDENEELFWAFNSALFQGYSFNYADPSITYSDVYYYDMKSFYSAILYYKNFPYTMRKKKKADYAEFVEKKKSYYGEFCISVKEADEYLYYLGSSFQSTDKKLIGWFNNIDIDFINKLCGITNIKCLRLYEVKLKPISLNVQKGIYRVYNEKENAPNKKTKSFYKGILQRLVGIYQTRKTFTTETVWNNERREFERIPKDKPDTWDDIKSRLAFKMEYAVGVWIQSYARLILLEARLAVGDNAIYGDIDSIMFYGEENIERIHEITRNHFFGIADDFTLGMFKLEAHCFQLKIIERKWYCYSYVAEDGEFNFEVKASGADNDIIRDYLKTKDNPVEAFTNIFPENVKPYKQLYIDENGIMGYKYVGSSKEDLSYGI